MHLSGIWLIIAGLAILVLWHQMDWWWMGLSIPFGILAQLFRGWRWKLTLEPMGEHPVMRHCVNAILVS